MSTFRAFQTGLMAGQQQAKVKREDDARMKAAEAFGSGNYEGAVSSLMGVGLMDDANAYGQAGERKKEAERTQAYADAFKTGLGAGPAPNKKAGYQAVSKAAGERGDFGKMAEIDQAIAGMDADQADQFGQSMEFLGQTALGLKQVPPEARGQAAMEILQNSPYANPQILAQIQQAAADGKITDEELDNFAMQTMSVAERVKLAKGEKPSYNTATTRDGIIAYNSADPNQQVTLGQAPLPATQQGPQTTYRPATPDEKAAYGLPPNAPAKVNTLTNEVTLIPGAGTAPKPTPMQLAVDKNYAAELVDWQTQGSTNFLKQMSQLEGALTRLESGEDLTGPASGIPGRNVWGQAGRAVQQQVEEVVQTSLKQVLGAQFTQKEGEGILARTFDPMQEESVNAERVRRLMAQLKLAAQQKNEAMAYYNEHGTMAGYQGHIPSMADFNAAVGAGPGYFSRVGQRMEKAGQGAQTAPMPAASVAPAPAATGLEGMTLEQLEALAAQLERQ